MMELKPGHCALILSILKGYTPEGALEYIETGKKPEGKHRFNSVNHLVDMIKLKYKENMSYKEIAEIYNKNKRNIFRKIKRVKKRKNTKDMVAMKKAGFYYYEIAEFYGDISKQGVYARLKREGYLD